MGCFNKFALFVINFIVFGVGVAVVVLASLVISKDNVYGVLLKDGVFSLPIVVLIAGLVILVIGFLGCCGAVKESSCMLQTYAVIVLLLLIAEIILGILILVYTSEAEKVITDGMEEVFKKYGLQDESLTKSLDHAQQELQCCGVANYTDWERYPYGQEHLNSVADGCCLQMTDGCGRGIIGQPDIANVIYMNGCYGAIKLDLQGEALGLGIACIVLALVQLLSISCACGIAKKSSRYA